MSEGASGVDVGDASGRPVVDRAEPPAEPGPAQADALEVRLERLEEQGAARIDGPALELIRRLIAQAGGLGEAGRERLLRRAGERASQLEARCAARREVGARTLERLAGLGFDPDGLLAEALGEGDVTRLMRASRRHASGERRPTARAPEQTGLYRDALADLAATIAVAAAEDSPPEQAGRLNGSVLATRVLRHAGDLSPAYRRILVARLLDLAPLLHLPPLPMPRKRG